MAFMDLFHLDSLVLTYIFKPRSHRARRIATVHLLYFYLSFVSTLKRFQHFCTDELQQIIPKHSLYTVKTYKDAAIVTFYKLFTYFSI